MTKTKRKPKPVEYEDIRVWFVAQFGPKPDADVELCDLQEFVDCAHGGLARAKARLRRRWEWEVALAGALSALRKVKR